MITDYIQQIRTYFRNKTLNAIGAERTLYELMEDADVETAIAMMQNRDPDVDAAIKEYNAKRGIVEEEVEDSCMSGIPSRPYCKGRNYDPNRYASNSTEE